MQTTQPASENRQATSAAATPFFMLAHDPLCLLDSSGRVIAINPAFVALLGYQQEEAAGVAFLEWIHPEDRRASVAVLGAALTNQQVGALTARLRDQGGGYRLLHWQVTGQGGQLFLAAQPSPAAELSPQQRAAAEAQRVAASLEAVAAIGSAAATRRELDQMLQEVADVTRQRFGLAQAQIYLLNAAGDALELVAAAGETAHSGSAVGHTVAVHGEHSPVARAARERQSALADDLAADGAALALPMLAGDQLVGVLAVQDGDGSRFDETDAGIFSAVASQAAVAVETARSFARSQEAVAEMNSLMRRLTREGWEAYLREQSPELSARGFQFDANRVSPLAPLQDDSPALAEDDPAVLAAALQIHDEVVGQLALVAADGVFDDEAAELAAAIAEQLSARIENLRLTNETQRALTETAALYRAGAELNRARSYDEVLEVMRAQSVAGREAGSLALLLFDQPLLPGTAPGRVDVAAHWSDPAAGAERPAYSESLFADLAQALQPDDLTVVASLAQADSVDVAVRDFLAGAAGAQSALFAPLVAGGQWIGYLAAAYPQPVTFAGSELQRLRTLVGQASVAIQSISLLQAAQQRARRERVLREVSTRVRSVTDVDLIMRTAVREIGQVLGRETFLYLGAEEPAAADNGAVEAGHEAGQGVNGDE